jgi:hypothetical protein
VVVSTSTAVCGSDSTNLGEVSELSKSVQYLSQSDHRRAETMSTMTMLRATAECSSKPRLAFFTKRPANTEKMWWCRC